MVGFECALKPTPFPPMRSVLGGVLVPDGKMRVPSVNININSNLTTAALSPGGLFVSGNKLNNEFGTKLCHVSFVHVDFYLS